MTRQQLSKMYDQLKELERVLAEHGAPKSMVRRAHDCLLAVSWEMDYRDTD